ncbi:MaoC family dehydratase N-terminal domain-containing protein [Actinoalloteichus spitiensis]|uniref:MaoC family dehydratase N-terminal domain-containing protein n=1 Tax=Actinoalloteichus spitiensis TaxID=252394 RepID=UPI000474DD3B|nr:MaoC family dehydratase N-terminal domain-containing protein [Actinoalloteichus spitiensis]
MGLDQRFVGRAYPPTDPYEVGREKIREFADAVGDPSPVYRDPAAARAAGHPDVIAPPTFAFLLSVRANEVIVTDPELGLDYGTVVHGDQSFEHHRPIRAGDRLVVTAHVDAVSSRAGNEFLTLRSEVTTEDGEAVVTARTMLVARGTADSPAAAEAEGVTA